MTANILEVLPLELVIHILTFLSYRDLLTCSQLCRLLHTTIKQNALLQYTIELAVGGMQNGPPGVMAHVNRLTTLRNSQAAWNKLKWTDWKDVPMLQGTLYELYGGILVQSTHLGGLVFRRLPSHYRGIEEHVWSLDLHDVTLRDFTLDPAQDLLVLIARPVLRTGVNDARIEISTHLRSLTSGKEHPLATQPPTLIHDMDLRAANVSFMVQIHGDHVAVHFVSHGTAPSELVVWNWKTGQTLLDTYSANLMASSFLTDRLILVGGFGDVEFNLTYTGSERIEFDEVDYLCAFFFLIRSDPSTNWSPPASSPVPFSIGPGPRLYIVTIWVMQGEEISPIDLLGEGETRHDFEWTEWGPASTRMIAQAPHAHVWFSSIITSPRETRNRNPRTLETEKSWILEDVEWHVGDTSILSSRVFMGEIRTTLPYRIIRRTLPAPLEGEPVFTEAMCSEDNLILVDAPELREVEMIGQQMRSMEICVGWKSWDVEGNAPLENLWKSR
ncbi:hypothetical protein BU15DRAFT_85930 [Melanogaster broomeanus]|nr:hypothetical protein BU15DRAFT_85930 [Melanogaster broomeanus]